MAEGERLVIGGVTQSVTSNTVRKVPVLGESAGVMILHTIASGDRIAADFADLGLGCGPVQTRGDQNRNPLARDARLLQPLQNRRQHQTIRCRPRYIAY